MPRGLWPLLLLAGSVGCALGAPAPQSVPVITDPPGATAAAGSQRITTPGSLIVPAGAREMEIRVELDGYEPATVLLTRPGSSAFAGCLQRAASGPQRGSNEGALQGPVSGLIAIAIAASRAAAECSMEADVLVPTFVLVKLVTSSADLAPLPLGRSIGGFLSPEGTGSRPRAGRGGGTNRPAS